MSNDTDEIYRKNILDLEQQLHDARMKIISLNNIKCAAKALCEKEKDISSFTHHRTKLTNAICNLKKALNDEE